LDDCAICLNSLYEEAPEVEENEYFTYAINTLKPKKNQVMKTPCNHKFHVKCLVGWLAFKHECPTDRSVLPPIE